VLKSHFPGKKCKKSSPQTKTLIHILAKKKDKKMKLIEISYLGFETKSQVSISNCPTRLYCKHTV
jgi:hypothetical protein